MLQRRRQRRLSLAPPVCSCPETCDASFGPLGCAIRANVSTGKLPGIIVTPRAARKKPETQLKRKRPSAHPAPTAPPKEPTIAAVPNGANTALVKISPASGSELLIGKVLGSVSTAIAAEITRTGAVTLDLEEALQRSVPGVTLSDLQGNAFRTGLQFQLRSTGSGPSPELNGRQSRRRRLRPLYEEQRQHSSALLVSIASLKFTI
jgi:hypothetical protein